MTAGSLGARKINDAIWPALPRLLERCVVLHVTGAADEAAANEQRARLTAEQQARYVVRGYLDDMPAALVAADLVVARAGASTLGELPAAGAPAVLVPGEYEGWSQAPNAEFLQARGRGGDAAQQRARRGCRRRCWSCWQTMRGCARDERGDASGWRGRTRRAIWRAC